MIIEGKYVAITGANRGIGYAFAEACAVEKAHLILIMRSQSNDIEHKLKSLGAASVEIIQCDLSSQSSVEILAQKLQIKQVDILFNNAGLLTGGLLENQPLEDIYSMLQVNLNALVHLTQAVLPQMLKQKSGKIINHSSVSAIMHFPCASTYAAAKAAVWAFTNCLRVELQNTGVSTLCLMTPGVKTEMFDNIQTLYANNIDVANDFIEANMYGRMIATAVKNDVTILEPTGATGLAYKVAIHFRGLFDWFVSQKYHR